MSRLNRNRRREEPLSWKRVTKAMAKGTPLKPGDYVSDEFVAGARYILLKRQVWDVVLHRISDRRELRVGEEDSLAGAKRRAARDAVEVASIARELEQEKRGSLRRRLGVAANPHPGSEPGRTTDLNPARREFIDDLTGTRVSPTIEGAQETGLKVMRLRPDKGEPFETVDVEREDLDWRKDTFGLEKGARATYKALAEQQAKERRALLKKLGKPVQELEGRAKGAGMDQWLSAVGITTTYKNARAGAEEFMGQNPNFFRHQGFDDVDAYDVTAEVLDRIEVARGKRAGKATFGGEVQRKTVSLSKTKRGKEILSGKGRGSGAAIVEEMLVYLFGRGQTGKTKRWRDAPWSTIEDYLEQVGRAMTGNGSPALEWYPVASGVYDDAHDQLLVMVDAEYGSEKAQRLARFFNSDQLELLARRYESILKPPKGAAGKDGRQVLKCIPKDSRRMLRHRVRVLRDWSDYPELAPDWACRPEGTGGEVGLCSYQALWDDYFLMRAACDEPYNVNWPEQLRRQLFADGRYDLQAQEEAGIYPMDYDPDRHGTVAAPLEEPLPWEEEVAVANPCSRAELKRRLMR